MLPTVLALIISGVLFIILLAIFIYGYKEADNRFLTNKKQSNLLFKTPPQPPIERESLVGSFLSVSSEQKPQDFISGWANHVVEPSPSAFKISHDVSSDYHRDFGSSESHHSSDHGSWGGGEAGSSGNSSDSSSDSGSSSD